MQIKTFVCGPIETASYVAYEEKTRSALIIDAPPDSFKQVMEFIKDNNLNPELLVLTHGHLDHIADADAFQRSGIKIIMHEHDLFWLNPPEYMLAIVGGNYKPCKPDIIVKGGEVINLGEYRFIVLHTPGHSQGGICIYCREENVLFAGDTLFQESIGRTDLPGGSMDIIINSINEKLLTLPDETVVYPGHGDSTKIKNEKKYNPYLQNIGEE